MHMYFLMFHVLVHLSISIEEKGWIKIPCRANTEKGVKYRRINWYKVEGASDVLTGLVSKNLMKNTTTLYKFAAHSYEIGEDNSLLIPAVTQNDCGTYRCTLWPPLGHYIQEVNIEYSEGCIKPHVHAVGQVDALHANYDFKVLIVPCTVWACAVVIMFFTLKATVKNKKKRLVKLYALFDVKKTFSSL